MKLEKSFLNALNKTFEAYKNYGPRSNKKLIPIHRWFAETIKKILGNSFELSSLGDGGELKLDGMYYPKRLDIAVSKKDRIVSTVSFKFVTSNYKQNSNNYFENLLGETANIRRVNVGFAHFLVLRAKTPYYNKDGEEIKSEILSEDDLLKYIKLFGDFDFPHKPQVLGIVIIDFDNDDNCQFANLDELNFSGNTKNILYEELSLEKFIERFCALCILKG